MARPIKQGLDYFPLDVDIDQDDKIQLIEALHGIIGFGATVKLLMRIYKEGFYYNWTDMEQILFAKRVDVDINSVRDIVNDCIKYGVFDQGMFDQHQILTSRGIQMRYFEAVTRRKSVEADESYLLVNAKNYSNINRTIVDVDINSESVVVNEDISTQSKVKESKGEKEQPEKIDVDSQFEEWWNLYDNKKGKAKCLPRYKLKLKKNPHELIMAGTEKYFEHRNGLSVRGEFVPNQMNPYTFLNGEHFNDEYEKDKTAEVTRYKELGDREY